MLTAFILGQQEVVGSFVCGGEVSVAINSGEFHDCHQNCQFVSKDGAPYSELIALLLVWPVGRSVGRSFDRSVGQRVSP